MDIVIKPFDALTAHELYAILRLRCDVFIVEQTCPYPDIDGRDALCHHLMMMENGELVAYLRVLPAGVAFDTVALGRVVVRGDKRGTGRARILMRKGIDLAVEMFGESDIKLAAQQHLVGFYGSFGFVPISEPYLEDDIPHQDMLLHI